MRCFHCPHRETKTKAGTESHFCTFTGAQVASFLFVGCDTTVDGRMTSDGQRDDPDAMCPVTLDRLNYLSTKAAALTVGPILRQIDARGKLGDLMACYSGKRRAWLEGIVAEGD